MLVKTRKFLMVCTASVLLWGAPLQYTFAAENSDNLMVSGAIQINFKYEKTIDLTNGDRTRIPNVDFNFTLGTTSDGSMVNKTYQNAAGQEVFSIVPGSLPEDRTSMPFSTVQFRDTDTYDPKLTALLDGYGSAEDIMNYILKYSWGELHTSNHIETIIARPVNEEEKAIHNSGRGNGWPEDTFVWRCFDEGSAGSYAEGCQSLLEYPFDDFNVVEAFRYRDSPSVNHLAYGFRRPVISHISLGADGLYDKISKPLMTTDEYHTLVETLGHVNMPESQGTVFRFLLKEDPNPDDAYVDNQEVKIVDLVLRGGELLIFNSLEEADRFYTEAANNNLEVLPFTDMVPRAGFTNYIEPETPSVEPETPPVNPETPSVKPESSTEKPAKSQIKPSPKTSDNSRAFLYFALFSVSTLGVVATFKGQRKKVSSRRSVK